VERISKSSGGNIVFISSFEINVSQKGLVDKTFRKKCISYKTMDFRVDRGIGLGHRIVAGSLIIDSSIRSIVDQFKAKLGQAL
jgi:F0F1-type ATP synthase delta subunit